MSKYNIYFQGEIRKNINTFCLKGALFTALNSDIFFFFFFFFIKIGFGIS